MNTLPPLARISKSTYSGSPNNALSPCKGTIHRLWLCMILKNKFWQHDCNTLALENLTCHHQGPQLVKVLCRYQRGLHKAYKSQEENISKEKPSLLIHWWQRDVPAKHSNSNFPLLFKIIQQFYQRWLFLSLKHRKSWSSSIFEIPAIFAYRSAGIVGEFQNWWITTTL